MSNIVLAIVGLPGSGKSEVTDACLATGLFAGHVFFSEVIFDELDKLGLPHAQEHERPMREELRSKHGMGMAATFMLPKIRAHFEKGNVLIESHYSTEEYEILKREFGDSFKVLAVFAPRELRTKRLATRPERPLTAEETVTRDMTQIKNTHQAGPITLADYMILNISTLEELKEKVLAALERLGIKS